MSDQAQEQTQTQPAQQDSSAATFPLSFVKRETGRTHTIDGGQTTVPITHGETGEPESEYALIATIDGVEITLASYNSGRIDTQVKAGQQSQQQQPTEV